MWVAKEMPRTRKGKLVFKYFQNQGKKIVESLPKFYYPKRH